MGFLDDAIDREASRQATEARNRASEQAAYDELVAASRPMFQQFLSEARRFRAPIPIFSNKRTLQEWSMREPLFGPKKYTPTVVGWERTPVAGFPLMAASMDGEAGHIGVCLVDNPDRPFLVESTVKVSQDPRQPGSSHLDHAMGFAAGSQFVAVEETEVPQGALPRVGWRVDAGGHRHLQLLSMTRMYYRKYDEMVARDLRTVLEDTMLEISRNMS